MEATVSRHRPHEADGAAAPGQTRTIRPQADKMDSTDLVLRRTTCPFAACRPCEGNGSRRNDRTVRTLGKPARRVIMVAYMAMSRCSEVELKMAKSEVPEPQPFETVEPIGKRILIRKDEDKKETKGGIRLPDNIEIPTITGRIVAVSAEVENMPEIPLARYDKVLFNPKGAIPVDFEGDNRLFVVEVENVVAVFRKA